MSVSKKYCDDCGVTHTALMCFNKPRSPFKPRKLAQWVPKEVVKEQQFRYMWINNHPGPWQCYLNISPDCLHYLEIDTLTLEHVIPKSRGKEYKYDVTNIRPSCYFCNSLKGSRTLKALSRQYPHLEEYL